MIRFVINPKNKLNIEDIETIVSKKLLLSLSPDAIQAITKGRAYLDDNLKNANAPVYGINTGFGSLCNIIIPDNELEKLQYNLIVSHACGIGNKVPTEIIKLMLLLKVQSLSYGNSGVQLCTVERLIELYNLDILPVIYEQGSLGASGDLAPLAHLVLPLLGLGKVYYNGEVMEAIEALKEHKLQPIALKSKEGLALLNGTQFMSAYAIYSTIKAKKLNKTSDIIAAISLEAFDGVAAPFDQKLHDIRPHNGQIETAKNMRTYLNGSQIINQKKQQVQDPYSFRCIPQVHGASKDTLNYVSSVFTTEINSVTDNPTIFPNENEILSGGNFHGQPLALALDFLAIATAELANISERRTYQLISGNRNLPAFLIKNSGLNSGFMIPQYTAASIVSQNKQLCTPASVDSIVSSNGQEDHVSMGANAAVKCLQVIENVEKVLAIELLNASQAITFRRPLKSSPYLEKIITDFQQQIPVIEEDTILHDYISNSIQFVQQYEF